jgi:hypothetical protein
MSVFNRKFFVSDIRKSSTRGRLLIRQRNELTYDYKIKNTSLDIISEEYTDKANITNILAKRQHDVSNSKILHTKDFSNISTLTKTSSCNKKNKRVKFREPLMEVVKVECYKKYQLEDTQKKKHTATCRCLIF